jgi:hypothetical protein
MLQRLYDLRHNKGQLVRLPDGLGMPDVDEHVLANILEQLRDKGLVKWHRTAGGLCRGAANITTDGVYEIESQKVVIPPVEITMPTAHPTHTLIVWFTFIIGVLLVLAGVVLVWLGAQGSTKFNIFGNDFSSDNVGIASLFIGAVLVILNFRRVLKSVERVK